MENQLQRCAFAFQKLLDTQYEMILGRKGQLSKIVLGFSETEFAHLTGLHKLTDNDFFRTASRKKIFESALAGTISDEVLMKSVNYSFVKERIACFEFLENMLDSNELVFRCHARSSTFSLIQANYLLQSDHHQKTIYIFLDQLKDSEVHFCRSFFPKGNKDYTIGQAKYTLLYKRKMNKITGETEIQLDRLFHS